ncbi:MAG: hypothetical protein U0798_15090 [Gemmataceae bacterium]
MSKSLSPLEVGEIKLDDLYQKIVSLEEKVSELSKRSFYSQTGPFDSSIPTAILNMDRQFALGFVGYVTIQDAVNTNLSRTDIIVGNAAVSEFYSGNPPPKYFTDIDIPIVGHAFSANGIVYGTSDIDTKYYLRVFPSGTNSSQVIVVTNKRINNVTARSFITIIV